MPYTDSSLPTRDHLTLRTRKWLPSGPVKAVIVSTHGHGEHVGRYFHVGQFFSENGYAVYQYDLRGHGKSGGPRGHVPKYDAYLDDLQAVLDLAKAENSTKKIFLFAHSLGGQITLNFVLRRQPAIAGLVLSAPWLMLKIQPPAWKVFLGQLLKNILPTLALSTDLDKLVKMSHDEVFLNAMPEIALNHTVMTTRLGAEALDAAQYALEHAAEVVVPFVVTHGSDDNTIDPAGSQQLYLHSKSPDKTHRVFKGLLHETHNDTEKDRQMVLKYWVNWLNERA